LQLRGQIMFPEPKPELELSLISSIKISTRKTARFNLDFIMLQRLLPKVLNGNNNTNLQINLLMIKKRYDAKL